MMTQSDIDYFITLLNNKLNSRFYRTTFLVF